MEDMDTVCRKDMVLVFFAVGDNQRQTEKDSFVLRATGYS